MLVCVDVFTKWIEVVPLRRHDRPSVATAFTSVCRHWGSPDVIRVDNGSEIRNTIVESLFQLMGAEVRTGATRHPQSQGSVERANRTILSLLRRVLEHSSDWAAGIERLLFYYRVRPHSSTELSPIKAMVGWECPHFIVEGEPSACAMSEWAVKVSEQSAQTETSWRRICQNVTLLTLLVRAHIMLVSQSCSSTLAGFRRDFHPMNLAGSSKKLCQDQPLL